MKRFKKVQTPESLFEKAIVILKNAGLTRNSVIGINDLAVLSPLPERLIQLQKLLENGKLRSTEMLLWVCYDIEDNRIRRNLAKYLERKGMIRIQKSVFIGRISIQIAKELRDTLKKLSELYTSSDSMLIIPLSEDQLPCIHCLGKEIVLEQLESKSTYFF